jgi:hypothetical protein
MEVVVGGRAEVGQLQVAVGPFLQDPKSSFSVYQALAASSRARGHRRGVPEDANGLAGFLAGLAGIGMTSLLDSTGEWPRRAVLVSVEAMNRVNDARAFGNIGSSAP